MDVREAGESQKGHIPSSTFLPRRMLEFRLPEIINVKNTAIVIYDSGAPDDNRARYAEKTLANFGFGNVSRLDGGFAGWQDAGYEIATGWNVPSKEFGEQVLVTEDIPYMESDELARRLDAGERIGVVDVRTMDEFRESSLPASVSGSSFDWILRVGDLSKEFDGIVLHCAGRTRSIIGAATARLMGLPQYWALENGTMGWRLSGRELRTGGAKALPSPSPNSIKKAAARAQSLADDAGAAFISPAELNTRCENRHLEPVYIFDTRNQESYESGHIPNSILLPGGQACQRTDDFAAIPGAHIVFVDDDDARAAMAAYWYRKMGFKNVWVLNGGLPAWSAAGFETVTGRDRPLPLGIESARNTPKCGVQELANWLKETLPPVVIDVGSSKHFGEGHVEGAIWVPRGFLEDRIGSVAGPASLVVVTAKDPDQAAFAAETLGCMGYANVKRLEAPGNEWATALPIETGLPDDADEPSDTLAIPYRQGEKQMNEYLEWEIKLGEKHAKANPGQSSGNT